ncbi:MAG: hypothetical protein GX456_12335, partial [Verrucomicrobia bacterium]|nr:hypothetical protein [Verrucomicrobiota bacterium]
MAAASNAGTIHRNLLSIFTPSLSHIRFSAGYTQKSPPTAAPDLSTQAHSANSPVVGGEESPRSYRRVGQNNEARSTAVPGRINPTTDRAPVSITQTLRPNIHRLGAGKNARAPARAGKSNSPGSAAVLGRINPTTDRAPASITQTMRPTIHRLGAGKNARAPARA